MYHNCEPTFAHPCISVKVVNHIKSYVQIWCEEFSEEDAVTLRRH